MGPCVCSVATPYRRFAEVCSCQLLSNSPTLLLFLWCFLPVFPSLPLVLRYPVPVFFRYEGEWENDLQHGQGTFYFADSSCFKGTWVQVR